MTRIVAGEVFQPDEYDAQVEFEGWEEEDGTDETGWTIKVHDKYHNAEVALHVVFAPNGEVRVSTGHVVKA